MIRTFIAIQFPDQVKQRIWRSISSLKEQVGQSFIRWVDPALYHLTLKFLGDVDEERVDRFKKTIGMVALDKQPMSIVIGEFGVFPDIHRPRVLWVGLHEASGALRNLKQSIELAFEPEGFKVEARRFHPHVTVARVRRGANTSEIDSLKTVLSNFKVDTLGHQSVMSIHLVQSQLTTSGPIYTDLGSMKLGGNKV